jgi:uncharacterized membrane protein
MDETGFAQPPTLIYGVNLLLAAVAYFVLQRAIYRSEGGEVLRQAVGRDLKGKLSPVLYAVGIAASFMASWISVAIFTMVALVWLVPDRRMERFVAGHAERTA